jgi:hypothetical protein
MLRHAICALAALFFTGAGAAMLTDMPGQSHRGPLPQLSAAERELAERLQRHVSRIASREHNTAHPRQLEEAARYIEAELKRYGHTVHRQEFEVDGVRVRNLEVRLSRGPGAARETIVVGAHYDSAPGAPGANDNGTGVAAVLELARTLTGGNVAPGRELRLVLFVNEEPPWFKSDWMGSLVHARQLRQAGAKVSAMLSLETLGYYADRPGSQHYPAPLDKRYPDTGNFIGFVGDFGSRDLVRRCIGVFRAHAAFPSEGLAAPAALPGVDWSDHWAYRQQGYPAIMVTDTAPYRYPYYHSAEDTPDKPDYGKLAQVVSGIQQVVLELAAAH